MTCGQRLIFLIGFNLLYCDKGCVSMSNNCCLVTGDFDQGGQAEGGTCAKSGSQCDENDRRLSTSLPSGLPSEVQSHNQVAILV